jgi:hypothetical protein
MLKSTVLEEILDANGLSLEEWGNTQHQISHIELFLYNFPKARLQSLLST